MKLQSRDHAYFLLKNRAINCVENRLINVGNPVDDQDAATMGYVKAVMKSSSEGSLKSSLERIIITNTMYDYKKDKLQSIYQVNTDNTKLRTIIDIEMETATNNWLSVQELGKYFKRLENG